MLATTDMAFTETAGGDAELTGAKMAPSRHSKNDDTVKGVVADNMRVADDDDEPRASPNTVAFTVESTTT